MSIMSMFGVTWLERCFQRCLEDDDLQRHYGPVCEGLAQLIMGSYENKTKQAALFSLLGPTFVCQHLSCDDSPKLLPTSEAAGSQIKQELESLATQALTKFLPGGLARDELSEKMKRKVSECLQWAIYRDQEDSNNSLTLGQEDEWDEIETLLGKSLAAIIQYDEEKQFNQNLRKLAQDTFRANYLVLPQQLRRELWSEQLEKHYSKVLDRPNFNTGFEKSFSQKIKLGRLW